MANGKDEDLFAIELIEGYVGGLAETNDEFPIARQQVFDRAAYRRIALECERCQLNSFNCAARGIGARLCKELVQAPQVFGCGWCPNYV